MTSALEMKGINKYFASTEVMANDNVDFSVEEGEIHALVGENGAGKTTLMNILYGLLKKDSGEIFLHGEKVEISHPDDAIALGIGMVHQHFKLVPSFTIAQNVMLGIEPNKAGFLNQRTENEAVKKLGDSFGLPVDPRAKIRDLPVGMQQRVEILKTLQRHARLLILDEPTAVLTPQEVKEFLEVVRRIADNGCTVVFITHKLIEVVDVADRVSVMRNGRMIGTRSVKETSIPEMARMMVGREVLFRVEKKPVQPGKVVFEAMDLSVTSAAGVPAVVKNSFKVREGEIYGVAGVSGNGQTEMVEAITGMRPVDFGKILLMDKDITHADVETRRDAGMAHIPEDRIKVGLNMQTTLDENIIVDNYRKSEFQKFGFMLNDAIKAFAANIIKLFNISGTVPGGGVSNLSGGNMQKVVIGRELSGNPKLIVANQPTRGLDVGSIEFVHQTLLEARENHAAILLVSVELDEIMSLSDRIGVLYRGEIVGELDATEATEEQVGILMAGGTLESLNEPDPSNRVAPGV
ncbi:MAG: ABC transporter ATP-binding protein [Chloroflexi bacterium]|nr:ABC transporter ATP-binding protein [Chloroflexota bacterium]